MVPPDRHDPSVSEGVEHLQVAAHEMLAAARSFLDVVEEVVSDPEKMSGVAASLSDLLGSAGTSLSRLVDRSGSPGAGAGEAPTDRPRIRRIDVE